MQGAVLCHKCTTRALQGCAVCHACTTHVPCTAINNVTLPPHLQRPTHKPPALLNQRGWARVHSSKCCPSSSSRIAITLGSPSTSTSTKHVRQNIPTNKVVPQPASLHSQLYILSCPKPCQNQVQPMPKGCQHAAAEHMCMYEQYKTAPATLERNTRGAKSTNTLHSNSTQHTSTLTKQPTPAVVMGFARPYLFLHCQRHPALLVLRLAAQPLQQPC